MGLSALWQPEGADKKSFRVDPCGRRGDKVQAATKQPNSVCCKKYAAPRTFHTRKLFSRVAQVAAFCVLSPETIILARMLCFALCLTLSTPTSSSLLFPPNWTNLCAPQSGLLFGRFAEQTPLTSCEPNALFEVSSTEVTTTLSFARKASNGSTYNSGEDTVRWDQDL